jgi:large subunit ribosomal protein L3
MSIAPINKGILGKKVGNTQFFNEKGDRIHVTIVEVGPCTVVQKKNAETDGYTSIQLGFMDEKKQNVNKPTEGHFKKAGLAVKRHLKEFKFCTEVFDAVKVGDELTVAQFETSDFIDVTSASKGKGFAGVMKRYHFSGRPATHGTHESFRGPGSIGMHQTPGRVIKGRKMPGHMGDRQVTTQNLRIAKIDTDERLLYVEGTIPGGKNALVVIRDSVKKPSEPFYTKQGSTTTAPNEETKPEAN